MHRKNIFIIAALSDKELTTADAHLWLGGDFENVGRNGNRSGARICSLVAAQVAQTMLSPPAHIR